MPLSLPEDDAEDHGAPEIGAPEVPASRWGLALFGVYLAVYALFVFLSAFFPSAMEWTPLAGVNLAVVWGLGLIVLAFLLALLYVWIRRSRGGVGS